MTPSRREVVKYGIAGLTTTVGIAGVTGARPDKDNPGKGNEEARVNFPDQKVEDGETVEVSVKQAFLPDGGFVVIHEEAADAPFGPVIGNSEYLEPGGHGDIDIEVPADGIVDADGDGVTTLVGMAHRNTGSTDYTFPDGDPPYFVGNDTDNLPVIDTAAITFR
jgi:hypothetical protein